MATSTRGYHHRDLRRALLEVGEAMLSEAGAAGLSLREAARRIGVSHNAPFRHFASREALLAALAAEGYRELMARLTAATGGSAPETMRARGLAYVTFALERPAVFRLMFSDAVDRAAFPDLAAAAEAGMAAFREKIGEAYGPDGVAEATLAAWSFVHGLALLLLDRQATEDLRAGRSDLALAEATVDAMAEALAGEG